MAVVTVVTRLELTIDLLPLTDEVVAVGVLSNDLSAAQFLRDLRVARVVIDVDEVTRSYAIDCLGYAIAVAVIQIADGAICRTRQTVFEVVAVIRAV